MDLDLFANLAHANFACSNSFPSCPSTAALRRVSEEEMFEARAPSTAEEQREVENDGEVQALLGACKRLEILRRAIRTIRRRHDFRA